MVEGAVASVLWDIADTSYSHDESPGVDDDSMDGMLEEVWDLMPKYRPRSILEFWDHWSGNDYGQSQSLYSIYTSHGITVTPPQNVNNPSELASVGDEMDSGALLVLDSVTIVDAIYPVLSLEPSISDITSAAVVWSTDEVSRSVSRSTFREFSSWVMPPEHSALLQNFPNPFNPETWIPYQLREGSKVTIRIHSASGKLIREFDLGYKAAGLYVNQDGATYWDGRNESGERVADGVYLYSIQANDFAAVRKLAILR